MLRFMKPMIKSSIFRTSKPILVTHSRNIIYQNRKDIHNHMIERNQKIKALMKDNEFINNKKLFEKEKRSIMGIYEQSEPSLLDTYYNHPKYPYTVFTIVTLIPYLAGLRYDILHNHQFIDYVGSIFPCAIFGFGIAVTFPVIVIITALGVVICTPFVLLGKLFVSMYTYQYITNNNDHE